MTRLVNAAAVAGDFEPILLQRLLPGIDIWSGIAELRQRGIIDLRTPHAPKFLHHQLRDTTYTSIAIPKRSLLHRELASILQEMPFAMERRADWALQVAMHLEASCQYSQASAYYRIAGDAASLSDANGDAARYFNSAIACLERSGDGDLRVGMAELLERSGDLGLLMGDPEQAETRFASALSYATARLQKARLLRKCASTYSSRHNTEQALATLTKAEALLGAPGEDVDASSEWIDIQIDWAWALYWPGRIDQLGRLIAGTEPYILERGSERQRARFLQCAVLADMRARRYVVTAETLKKAESLESLSMSVLTWSEALSARTTVGLSLIFSGQAELALPVFENNYLNAKQYGDHDTVMRSLAYVTVAHRMLGNLNSARIAALELLAKADSSCYVQYRGLALANLGWVAMVLGQVSEAIEHLDEALSIWLAAAPVYPLMGIGAWPLLLIALQTKDRSRAKHATEVLLREDQPPLADNLLAPLGRLLEHAASETEMDDILERVVQENLPFAR